MRQEGVELLKKRDVLLKSCLKEAEVLLNNVVVHLKCVTLRFPVLIQKFSTI